MRWALRCWWRLNEMAKRREKLGIGLGSTLEPVEHFDDGRACRLMHGLRLAIKPAQKLVHPLWIVFA